MPELLEISDFIEFLVQPEPSATFSIISSMETIFQTHESSLMQWAYDIKPLLHYKIDKSKNLLHVTSVFKAFYSSENVLSKFLSCWLVPSKICPIYAQNMHSFNVKGVSTRCCFSSISLYVCENDWARLEMMLSIVLSELEVGLLSFYHAQRILDIKALSFDQKNFVVQESVIRRVQKFPKLYDYDIFALIQRFFLAYSQTFNSFRSRGQLLDTILSLYLCQSSVKSKMSDSPSGSTRHVSARIRNHQVQGPLGYSTHQTVIVCFQLLDRKEVFEQNHFLRAVQSLIKGGQYVQDSFFSHKDNENSIGLFSIEVESNNQSLCQEQRISFAKRLESQVPNFIQALVNPVFMPLNEEEIMKSIVQLSSEIKSLHDIPQMILNFEKQELGNVYFRAILVRVIKKDASPLASILMKSRSKINIMVLREKRVCFEGTEALKEIGVFRVSLSSQSFLRQDFSLDVFKARDAVFTFFNRTLTEVRDFNGAMLSFEVSAFTEFSRSLRKSGIEQKILIEQFYYSIFPAQKRLVVHRLVLKRLFMLFHEEVLTSKNSLFHINQEFFEDAYYVVGSIRPLKNSSLIMHRVKVQSAKFDTTISFCLQCHGCIFVGAVFSQQRLKEMGSFIKQIQQLIS